MKGYVVRKGNQHYAVIYEGLDPVTGRERRRWYPAGPDRAGAEALALELASERARDRSTRRSSLTLGAYLTQRWLPGRRAAPMTEHVGQLPSKRRPARLPRIGRVPLRHLRPDHIERLYAGLLADGNSVRRGGLDAKTVLEIHMDVRRALDDAVRRGLIMSNPAAVAHAPKRRPLASAALRAWNAEQLRAFFDVVGDHRYRSALWVSANTGMRRGELLGLHWGDIDLGAAHVSVSRSLVSIGYVLHESRGKTRTSRRCVDLDHRTVDVLREWKRQRSEEDLTPLMQATAVPTCSPNSTAHRRIRICCRTRSRSSSPGSGRPRIRLHDLRHTHATLLLKAGVPIKVVSERLGHSTPGFTMATYQHVLPGMQAEAARTFASLLEDPPASTR